MNPDSCSSMSRSFEYDDNLNVDNHSDTDDDDDGVELLDAALKDKQENFILSILGNKPPWLIRVADPMGDTFLHLAARAGNEWAICELISFMEERPYLHYLELEKVFKDKNVNGDTALHLALRNGHSRLACYLLEAEKEAATDPTVVNNDGVAPLQLMDKDWHYRMCASMAYHYSGMEIHEQENLGQLPETVLTNYSRKLQAISADVEVRAVTEDLEGGGKSSSVGIRWAQLYEAINRGQEDVIATGLRINGYELMRYKDEKGETLLHAAVKAVGPTGMGQLQQLVQYLIGIRLMDAALVGNVNGDTALHLALQNKNLTVAHYLIKASPQTVYEENDKGESPLYLAVKAGHQDLVKYMCQTLTESHLLAYLTNNLLDCNSATLLHLAIKARASGTLKTLMEHLPGLINGKDKKGWRPLSYAAYKGYLNEVNYLLTNFPKSATKYDKDGSLPIHKAVGGGHVCILQAFSKHCLQSLHHVDKKGRSVLHIAVRYAKVNILAYLRKELEMDDSFLNLMDNEGKTFMDYAK